MTERPASRPEHRDRFRTLRILARRAAPFAAGIVITFTAIALFNVLVPAAQPLSANDVKQAVARAMASATPPPPFSVGVYQVIQPSLVLIESHRPGADGKVENDLGSGVIIDDAGDILTALHVVDQATDIKVTFADASESSAVVKSKQPTNDIAVLGADQLPAHIVPAVLGNPAQMQVGDEAYAVGNPFGLYGSMSAGVISGLGRTFTPPNGGPKLQGLIQFDAAANPGNSGGPLLNRDGQVIGIVEGIVNPTGQNVFVGIGFAVTINAATSGMGSPPD